VEKCPILQNIPNRGLHKPNFFSPAQPYRSLYGPGPAQPTATDPSLVRPVFSLP